MPQDFQKPSVKRDKAISQRIHAFRRAKERLGSVLTDDYYNKLILRIQTNKTECVQRQSNTRTLHRVHIHGKETIAVYDSKHKTVVTFLDAKLFNAQSAWIDAARKLSNGSGGSESGASL